MLDRKLPEGLDELAVNNFEYFGCHPQGQNHLLLLKERYFNGDMHVTDKLGKHDYEQTLMNLGMRKLVSDIMYDIQIMKGIKDDRSTANTNIANATE